MPPSRVADPSFGRAAVQLERTGEAVVRSALLEFLGRNLGGDARLIQELWIPPSQERADVAVVNGSLAGYEIKSGRDRLDRLPRQIRAYSAIFDKCFLVSDDRHLGEATGLLPPWWGIIRCSPAARFDLVRDGRLNPAISSDVLILLLWRAEIEAALRERGTEAPPRVSRASLRRELLSSCDPADLRGVVRGALLTRDRAAGRFSRAPAA